MAKFIKGKSYLVSSDHGRWYLVHQTGLKSWRAMLFTHMVEEWYGSVMVEGNATTLHERLSNMCNDRTFVVKGYTTNSTMRKDMFSILQTGKIGE